MLFNPRWDDIKVDVLLLEAANILEHSGWCQYAMQDEKGRLCMLGAIKMAMYMKNVSGEYYQRSVIRVMQHIGGKTRYRIPEWNDEPGRTKAEVVKALRDAGTSVYSSG